jgi:hypothetical protein
MRVPLPAARITTLIALFNIRILTVVCVRSKNV